MRPITRTAVRDRPGRVPRRVRAALPADRRHRGGIRLDQADPRAKATGSTHLPRLAKFQQFCEAEGVSPIYLVDYPVATSALAADILQRSGREGPRRSGHPAPSLGQPAVRRGSERAQLLRRQPPARAGARQVRRLREAIETTFDAIPQIYRAGRYGTGRNTAAMLREGGIAMDTSVRAKFNYSAEGGADLPQPPAASPIGSTPSAPCSNCR